MEMTRGRSGYRAREIGLKKGLKNGLETKTIKSGERS